MPSCGAPALRREPPAGAISPRARRVRATAARPGGAPVLSA